MSVNSEKRLYEPVDVKVTTFELEGAILIGSGDTNYLESNLMSFTLNSNI